MLWALIPVLNLCFRNGVTLFSDCMYGYNTVILPYGKITDKGTYYGVSAGVGYLLKVGKKGNFWNFELLVPFRNSNFYDDYDALDSWVSNSRILPSPIQRGFHFNVRTRASGIDNGVNKNFIQ